MSDPRIYIAGSDVYHPQGLEIAEAKKSICARYGLEGVAATDFLAGVQFVGKSGDAPGLFRERLKIIQGCDALVADITPFRGPSMDPATAFEIGAMAALGKPVAAYTLDRTPYAERMARYHAELDEALTPVGPRLVNPAGSVIEDFGLPEAVIIAGAALDRGTPIAQDFEGALRWVRRQLNDL
jgi:nucleoside 2-deoxyribosyltransferase